MTANPPEDINVLAMSFVWASGGILSTPDDVTSFIRAYAGRKLFGEAVQDQQLQLVDGHSEPIGPGRPERPLADAEARFRRPAQGGGDSGLCSPWLACAPPARQDNSSARRSMSRPSSHVPSGPRS